jgi:hypothetical protein
MLYNIESLLAKRAGICAILTPMLYALETKLM